MAEGAAWFYVWVPKEDEEKLLLKEEKALKEKEKLEQEERDKLLKNAENPNDQANNNLEKAINDINDDKISLNQQQNISDIIGSTASIKIINVQACGQITVM